MIWLLPLGVKTHQAQFLPNTFNHLLYSEIELARHDGCVGFTGQLVQEFEADAVDLVVDVQAKRGVSKGEL